MPGADHMNAAKVRAGMTSGTITLDMVDDAVLRILTPMFAVGVMDAGASAYSADKHSANVSTPEHMQIARELAANSTVSRGNKPSIHSLTHPPTHSPTNSLSHSPTYSLTHSPAHPLTHSTTLTNSYPRCIRCC